MQRFHVKWKNYSHIHNTDEMYTFLRTYKGAKKMENFIQKVWLVDQAYRHPAADAVFQPTREEQEQFEIDKERQKELLESYKIVERVLDEKQEVRDGATVNVFFCKWTSESFVRSAHCVLC